MQKIAGDGATVDGHFQDADASIGQVATEITDEWLNSVQDELVNVVQAAGLTLNPADNAQLLGALQLLAGSGRNSLINGDFQLWQRAQSTSFTGATAAYTADRWRVDPGTGNSSTLVVAKSAFSLGQTLVPGDPKFLMVWNQASGLNGSTNPKLQQRIENAYSFNGQLATLTFWAKLSTGTTCSATPKLRQFFGSGGSADVNVVGSAKTITSSWQKFTQVFNVPSTAGKTFVNPDHFLELFLEIDKTANVVINFADFDFRIGGVAPAAFERRTLQEQLLNASRYYAKSYELDTDPGTVDYKGAATGEESGVNFQSANTRYLVPMRKLGTLHWYSPDSGVIDKLYWEGADRTVNSTSFTSTVSTGYPVVGSTRANSKASAHYTHDAEL